MKAMKKLGGILLASVLMISSVNALDSITAYGKVKDITNTGEHFEDYTEIEGTTTDNNQTTIFDITNTKLEVIDQEKGDVEDRTVDDATWFGFSVTKPTTSEEDGFAEACWTYGEHECFAKVGNDYTMWVPFTAAELKSAIEKDGEDAVITKVVKVNWGGQEDTTNVQTIIVNLHAGSVTLAVDPSDSENKVAEDAVFTEEDKEAAVAVYEKAQAEANKPTPTAKPAEANPDTSDNAILLFGLIALGACGLGLATKKRLS